MYSNTTGAHHRRAYICNLGYVNNMLTRKPTAMRRDERGTHENDTYGAHTKTTHGPHMQEQSQARRGLTRSYDVRRGHTRLQGYRWRALLAQLGSLSRATPLAPHANACRGAGWHAPGPNFAAHDCKGQPMYLTTPKQRKRACEKNSCCVGSRSRSSRRPNLETRRGDAG